MKPVAGEGEKQNKRISLSSLWPVLRVILSLALLALLLYKFDLSRIADALLRANKGYLGAALGLYLLGIVISSVRWRVLLGVYDTRFSQWAITALYFVGVFFNNLLPGTIGGDVVKMYQLSRRVQRKDLAVSTVLMDRAVGLLALFAIAAAAVGFAHELVPSHISILLLLTAAAMWGGAWLFTRRTWWERLRDRNQLFDRLMRIEMVSKAYRAMNVFDRRMIARALGISLVFDAVWICVRYLIALALNVHLSFWYFLLFIPISSLITLLPISFSGLGVREGVYVYLFSQVGVDAPISVSMSLAFYGLRLVGGIIGGLIYALGARTYLGRGAE